jgi:hypothetical protein
VKGIVPSEGLMLVRLKEIRENKCLICKHHYDQTACLLHQIKDRDHCKQDLTDKEIAEAIHTFIINKLKGEVI